MTYVNDIISYFEKEYSDINCQSSWDFSGSQIYLGNNKINNVCVALDPTLSVVDQAVEQKCEMLITHHPLFFSPIKGLNSNRIKDQIIIKAVKNNLTILSYHTNLDMAKDGVNMFLLKALEAEYIKDLDVEYERPYVKLVIFTPVTHADELLDAMDKAGAGKIGNYRRCAFSTEGEGTFMPLEGSKPFLGEANKVERVQELRQEILVPKDKISAVVAAMKKAHPYEVPAFDIYDIDSPEKTGIVKVGALKKEYVLKEFITYLKKALKINNIRTNTDAVTAFSQVAVCGGSGSAMWKECLKNNIKILVTGDLKHHDAIDSKEAGICIIDVGHYHSEKIYMEYFAEVLKSKFDVNVYSAKEKPSLIEW